MKDNPTDAQLLAFLEETLPASEISALEIRLRDDPLLLQRLSKLRSEEDAGAHSLGAVWRRFRLSCLSREELGQYLLGVLESDASAYVKFHVERIGCRYCQANLEDLRQQHATSGKDVQQRRQRLFATSIGRLRKG
jgi:hypothetical protein